MRHTPKDIENSRYLFVGFITDYVPSAQSQSRTVRTVARPSGISL